MEQELPCWSELHPDLLDLIARCFNLIEDYLNFATVCKSWRSAATKSNFNSYGPRAPWLMLAEEEEEEEGVPCRKFFSLSNGMILKKRIPKASGKRCMDSMGWFITVGKDEGEISLLHPFSGVHIELPHQNTTQNYEEHQIEEQWVFVHKAVLTASPSHTSDYLLLVIEGNYKFVSFWRPGDLRWTRIQNETRPIHRDIAYFNGQIYAIDWNGGVLAYEVNEKSPTQIVAQVPLPLNCIGDELYIVESLGALFVVMKYGVMSRSIREDTDRIPLTKIPLTLDNIDVDGDNMEGGDAEEEEVTYGTTHFLVYELDLAAGKLTETKQLGDRALFLGANASLSVQASQFPGLKPNHIYFTEDYWEKYLCYEEGGGLDMGVFNLADGTIKPHYQGVSLSLVSPPTWVTPTLY